VPSTNILNESIFASPYFQHGRPITMFRASASNHRQHKHPSCRLCYRHALYQYAFALKSSELQTNNVLEYLATRPNTSSKSYELIPIIRIVHTTSMHKSLMTSHAIHSLPTNNSVDNNFQASWATSIYNNEPVVDNQYPLRNKIRKLLLRFQTKNDNLFESVEIPTISWNLYPSFINSEHNKIWILETS